MSLESVVVDYENAHIPGQIGVALGRAITAEFQCTFSYKTPFNKFTISIKYHQKTFYLIAVVAKMNLFHLTCKLIFLFQSIGI
jgi:hypothetical protein